MEQNYFIGSNRLNRIISTTRIYAPSHISIQVPPNLSPDINIFLKSGINDLGGISPLTIDWVNPDHLWPNIKKLKLDISNTGQQLKKRLPVYPEFIKKEWLNSKIFEKVNNIIDTNSYLSVYQSYTTASFSIDPRDSAIGDYVEIMFLHKIPINKLQSMT